MNNILKYSLCCLLLLSCKSKVDSTAKNIANKKSINDLYLVEKRIVNDFLEMIIKDDRYTNYPICIMKEGISKLSSLKVYEYCYNDRNLPIKNSTNKEWIINDLEIKKIKDSLNDSEIHLWNISDFLDNDITILDSSELKKIIKEGSYTKSSKKTLIYLSTPLLINDNNCLMSFRSGDSSFGFQTINSYTALLKKKKTGKWEIDSYYFDPNSTW
jgi:hypothetical protein